MDNKKAKIPWWEPKIGEEEHKFIKDVLDNNFPNEGKVTTSFEDKLCDLLDCRHAVAVTSGTSAIFLSLKALGICPGDEVIVPDMTFIATANAVEMCGAKPILADIDAKTLNLSIEAFSSSITKNTKAVIPVHISGRAANISRIMEIANANNIYVVEDAAEAFMSKHDGKYLGNFGKSGCFSFSPHKTVTTGQGGAIITDDDELNVRLRELKDQGRPVRGTGGDDVHNVIGYNFKFTDLQAAVGLGQLTYLQSRMDRMKRNYTIYREKLEDVKGLSLFNFDIGRGELPQWTDALADKRNSLDRHLSGMGIDCRRYWFPIHTQAPYRLPDTNFPNSTLLSPKALWLPSAFTLTDDNVNAVCDGIKEFFKK